MGGPRKKKYQSGEGAAYWSRNTALKKLQLSLKDFRRLCILKGIYPREPRNRKKAQHGDTSLKTLYAVKDIRFLLHEPIVMKIRELKTHGRKVARAKSLKEFKELKKLKGSYPQMSLDHIVKERYPTFLDAIRDLDDCLTMCFLFSTFPLVKPLPRDQPALCRRLTFEFLHAVIAGQSLRKVFVSIKGYYFQAEIKGQTVTWIMPHHFGYQPQPKQEVDFNIMSTFVQFYIVLLGFVNYRLYHSLNMYYPPKISTSEKRSEEIVDKESFYGERIAALTIPLLHSANPGTSLDGEVGEDGLQIDPTLFENEAKDAIIKKAEMEAKSIKNLKSLFKGLKVFINREVPRLPLVFTLKCFGAQVSWDKTLFVGATFDENDETITHEIVDRPSVSRQFISRYYVQPQWVFDSVNARRLLPVEKYFIGVELPPHLSPFVEDDLFSKENYVPFEQIQLNRQAKEEEEGGDNDGFIIPKRKKKNKKKATSFDVDDSCEKKDLNNISESGVVEELGKEDELVAERRRQEMKNKMTVKTGKIVAPDPLELKNAERQEYKLREKLVPRKYKRLYSSMMRAKGERQRDKNILMRKRIKLEKIKKRDSVENKN